MNRKLILIAALVVALVSTLFVLPTQESYAATSEVKIVGLGDSYTSGIGASDYESLCSRSANAYVHQYADAVVQSGYPAKSYNLACGGAVVDDVYSQVNSNRSTVESADIVVLTVGGNDINFSGIVKYCLALGGFLSGGTDCLDRLVPMANKLPEVVGETKELLKYISSVAKDAEIVLVGYPYIIGPGCSDPYGDIVRAGQDEYEQRAKSMVGSLSGSIRYLSLQQPFSGGEVCGSGPDLLNGTLSTSNSNEWWHPNKAGHAVIAQQLFKLGIHVFSGSTTTTTQQPKPESNSYANLPFACGVVVPFASTYDSFYYEGRTIYHNLSLDMPMPQGTNVVAPESGIVYVKSDPYGYGNYIDLHGDSGVIHRMAHLLDVKVANGARVSRSTVIARVGSTGASTGPHLHYEQRKGSTQTTIDLGGPALAWGSKQDSTGFRTTTHKLISGNCSSATEPVIKPTREDIIFRSSDRMAYSYSGGYTEATNGTVAITGFVPKSADSCNFDGGLADEYVALDSKSGNIMLADPMGEPNAHFYWRQIGNSEAATMLVCSDWNNDGLDDVIIHTTGNNVYVGLSDRKNLGPWQQIYRGMSKPSYWDMCDMNGDGRDEIVTYFASENQFYASHRIDGLKMNKQTMFGQVGGIGGIACGNFLSGGFDELIAWNEGHNGRYLLGWLDTAAYTSAHLRGLSPTGLSRPYNAEVVAGDIDGDGLDEFIVNERRSIGNHSIMVGDVTSYQTLAWHAYRNNAVASFIAVGNYVT